MASAFVFVPREYAGGTEQPRDWLAMRYLDSEIRENGDVVVRVTGRRALAPQDHDALVLFEQMYSRIGSSSSTKLVHDSIAQTLTLELRNTIAFVDDVSTLRDLVTNVYKVIELRGTDYGETHRRDFFRNDYVIERRTPTAKELRVQRTLFARMTRERAPDVFVRPE